MRGIARVGDKCHGTCYHSSHKNPLEIDGLIIAGSSDSFIGGRSIARIGDTVMSDCGHFGTIITGAPESFFDGRQHARLGDQFSGDYKGLIISASTEGY